MDKTIQEIRLARFGFLNRWLNTDKGEHGYWEVYSRTLPESCRTLLEIGVARGQSLKIWNDIFGANEVDIHCLDLFMNPEFVSARWCRNQGFYPIQGDQSDVNLLRSLPGKYEVAVDDGSHNAHHQIVSFKEIFWGKMTEGGIYYIEDCHCNLDSFYWGGLVHRFEDTPLHMFKEFLKTGEIVNPYFTSEDSAIFKKLIDSVEICAYEKLIVIKRK
jgi:hypothetical protein